MWPNKQEMRLRGMNGINHERKKWGRCTGARWAYLHGVTHLPLDYSKFESALNSHEFGFRSTIKTLTFHKKSIPGSHSDFFGNKAIAFDF